MSIASIRKSAKDILESYEKWDRECKASKRTWDMVVAWNASARGAKRTLELCDIYEKLEDSEVAELKAIPIYRLNDVMRLRGIKEKYDLSWIEVRNLVKMALSEDVPGVI